MIHPRVPVQVEKVVDNLAVTKRHTMQRVALAYLTAIVGTEIVALAGGLQVAVLCHAILVAILLNHYAWSDPSALRAILSALALTSLLRLLSITMPIQQLPQIYWYALVGAPLLVAVLLAMRLPEYRHAPLGLRLRAPVLQVAIALSGPLLSLVAYLLFRPDILALAPTWPAVALAALILFLFTGLTEELLFRGLVQRAAVELFGRGGLLFASLLFAAMYLGSLSAGYTLFMGSIGLLFGWFVMRTGSMWGVVVAHGLLNIGLFLLWPFIFR